MTDLLAKSFKDEAERPIGFVAGVGKCHAGHTQLTLSEMNDGLVAGMESEAISAGYVEGRLEAINYEHKTICVTILSGSADTILPGHGVFFVWQTERHEKGDV